jgi:hypothetical protein
VQGGARERTQGLSRNVSNLEACLSMGSRAAPRQMGCSKFASTRCDPKDGQDLVRQLGDLRIGQVTYAAIASTAPTSISPIVPGHKVVNSMYVDLLGATLAMMTCEGQTRRFRAWADHAWRGECRTVQASWKCSVHASQGGRSSAWSELVQWRASLARSDT